MLRFALAPARKLGGIVLEALVLLTLVFVLGGFWLGVYGQSGLAFVAWILSIGVAGKLYRTILR